MHMVILPFDKTMTFLILAVICFSGCAGPAGGKAYLMSTPEGPVAWKTTGSLGVEKDTYLDNGKRKDALLLEAADSARIMLSSPPIKVAAGEVFSVRFALRFLEARGEIFALKIKLYDRDSR